MFRKLIALVLFLSAATMAQNSLLSAVPASRLAHLRRGINLSEWFAQVYDPKGYTKDHFQNWITSADIALIKSAGFDHVRLSVNPQPMFMANRPDTIPPEYLSYLDAAVKMILDQGLSVVIDLHPDDDFKARLKEDGFVQQFGDFWRALAHHYASWDPERVFFEIMNEPEVADPYRWFGIQAKVVAAIRDGAPQQTIIAAGSQYSNDDQILFLEPLHDPNVIYNFHFYYPHIFTHQGATWGLYYWQWLRRVRYPSTPENAAQVAANVPDAVDQLAVIRYGQEHWDAARIDAEISQVADWAKQHSVPVVCNEFGVYRAYADPHDRAAWIKDVRTSLGRHNIGWAMWDYSGSFGVATKKDGKATLDGNIINALGLKIP
jgi:aryl-phospho-beta-D-glucosidase BglC (GH1 family)